MDHTSAYEVALQIAKQQNLPMLSASLPPAPLGGQYLDCLCKKRSHDRYLEKIGNQAPPTHRIKIDGQAKLQALQCHTSQWQGLNPENIFPAKLAEHFLTYEYFTLITM